MECKSSNYAILTTRHCTLQLRLPKESYNAIKCSNEECIQDDNEFWLKKQLVIHFKLKREFTRICLSCTSESSLKLISEFMNHRQV